MKIFVTLFTALIFLTPLTANAHKINSAMSIVDIDDDGQHIEITHKLFAHDLEHALDLGAVGLEFFHSKKGQKLVKEYIQSRFILRAKDGNSKFNFIGCELDGDILFVYFEASLPKAQIWEIDSNILQDVASNQTNYVNIHYKNNVQTLIFDENQGIANLEIK